jgi:hypothetical protein
MDMLHYNIFSIPKKHGFREIAEPLPELKQEQRNILKWLVSRGIQSSKFARGFTNRQQTAPYAGIGKPDNTEKLSNT